MTPKYAGQAERSTISVPITGASLVQRSKTNDRTKYSDVYLFIGLCQKFSMKIIPFEVEPLISYQSVAA